MLGFGRWESLCSQLNPIDKDSRFMEGRGEGGGLDHEEGANIDSETEDCRKSEEVVMLHHNRPMEATRGKCVLGWHGGACRKWIPSPGTIPHGAR